MSITPAYHDSPAVNMAFAADTAKFLRVVGNTSGQAAIAGISDKSIGVCAGADVDVSEDARGTVRLNQVGTQVMVAAKAIAAGAVVYAAASGKVSDVGTVIEGRALTAAGADGELIQVVPLPSNGVLTFTRVVDSAQASANSATVNTGLGVVLTHAIVQVYAAAGTLVAHSGVTFGTGGNAGQITVAAASLTLNDRIVIMVPIAPVAL